MLEQHHGILLSREVALNFIAVLSNLDAILEDALTEWETAENSSVSPAQLREDRKIQKVGRQVLQVLAQGVAMYDEGAEP